MAKQALKQPTDIRISAQTVEDLRSETGRSRIVNAAVGYLAQDRGINLATAASGFDWSLDFTLHIHLDEADAERT